jgi:uncharacterized protein (TIGR03663 family)
MAEDRPDGSPDDAAGVDDAGDADSFTPDGPGGPSDSRPAGARLRARLPTVRELVPQSRLGRAVVAITAVSVLARLLWLGRRVAHWDEGRVAFWTVRYMETGAWEYRPIVHGPFLFHVDRWLFAVLGPTDFAARLPVAVVGGLLPAAAWLLRERLRDAEVVALAALLGATPLLVYYSRFMRNDVLVAGFMLFALGFFVRLLDTGRPAHLYAGTAAFGLAFTTKENALVYVACWLGALALLVDHRLFRGAGDAPARTDGAGVGTLSVPPVVDRVGAMLDRTVRTAVAWRRPLALAGVELVAVLVFFYAPRAGGPGELGLWTTVANPTTAPELVRVALVDSWSKLVDTWLTSSKSVTEYPPRLRNYVQTIRAGAGVVGLFAVVGFVADRYGPTGPRDVVALAGYWGFVSVLGYPYATDIWAPWIVVHAVVPLAIPAAVGLAVVYRYGRSAVRQREATTATLAAVVLLAATVSTGVTAVDLAYRNADGHERTLATALGGPDANADNQILLHWAQPDTSLKERLGTVEGVADRTDGTDVLFYGTTLPNSETGLWHVPDQRRCLERPPVHEPSEVCLAGELNWHSRLPLPWYLAAMDATVTSSAPSTPAGEALSAPPPVVFAYAWDRAEVRSQLPARYTVTEHDYKLWGESIVVFVDRTA